MADGLCVLSVVVVVLDGRVAKETGEFVTSQRVCW